MYTVYIYISIFTVYVYTIDVKTPDVSDPGPCSGHGDGDTTSERFHKRSGGPCGLAMLHGAGLCRGAEGGTTSGGEKIHGGVL